MGDADNTLPPSKKRAAGREISKDNPGLDDDEFAEEETGTFKRASNEVLAGRRILKVRRNPTSSTTSSNPFAGIRLVPTTEPTTAPAVATTEVVSTVDKVSEDGKTDAGEEIEKGKDETGQQSESKIEEPAAETAVKKEFAEDKENNNGVNEATESNVDDNEKPAGDKVENEKEAGDEETENTNAAGGEESENKREAEGDKTESEEKKDNGSENADPSTESTRLSSFQQLSSSQNAFTGLAGTGFSTSTFTFGSVPKDGSASGSSTGSLFGQKNDQPSFGFGVSNNGSSSIFNTTGSSIISKNEGTGFPSMQEVPVETGEENERVVFSTDSVLFEFLNGVWKERGKGELKVNVETTGTEKARLLMRARGNYRLILNASLYPDMKLTNMDKRGITFACMNSTCENKDGLTTFALKFKDASIVEEFRAAVTAHKDKTTTVLKTPENSPKVSDE